MLNGDGAIARTQEHVIYRKGMPGFCLLDFDRKGMLPEMEEKIGWAGGFIGALMRRRWLERRASEIA
jgi:hypothetical protein